MTVNGWHERILGELVTVQGGFAFKSSDFVDVGVPIVRMSDLDDGQLDLDGAARIPEKKLKRLSNYALNDGDFLVGMSGSIENYAIVRKNDLPAYLNQRVGRFRLANESLTNYGFVTQVARSDAYKRHIESLAAGAAQVNISPSQIESFRFYAPPKPEQTKIAEILSTVDRAIEQTQALIAKQQRIKNGLMQDLLTRGIDEYGKLRSEETYEFEDSPLGRIPVEWEVNQLRSYLSYLSYGFTNPMPTVNDGPYMVTAANISNGVVQYDGCRRTSIEAYKHLLTKKSRPEIGDILITKDGTLGRLAIVDQVPLCINQSVAVLRPKEDVNNDYLKMLLETPACQERILADAGGSTIKHIYISKIDKMLVAVPQDTNEQEAIKLRLKSHSVQLHHTEQQLKKLGRLKIALMQDLLTGEVPVTPLLTEQGASA